MPQKRVPSPAQVEEAALHLSEERLKWQEGGEAGRDLLARASEGGEVSES